MCRLCLATYTDTHLPKSELIHECMMRSAHDELGQKDGWGVTDMQSVYRSARWYYEDMPFWKNDVNQRGFILSHLRKASGGTGRSQLENHPYQFDVNGQTLTAVHNGFFGGVTRTWGQTIPNTDSYHALLNLSNRLAEQHEITAPLITDWLSQYNDDSHYACILHWRDVAYMFRGSTRTLAIMQVGNGVLVHTNILILDQMREYLHRMYAVDTPAAQIVPVNVLVTIPLASHDLVLNEIHPVHTRAYVQQTQWPNRVITPPKQLAVGTKNESEEDASHDVIIAPSVTKPRDHSTPAAPRLRRAAFADIVSKLSPMRRGLAAMWASIILEYEDEKGAPDVHAFRARATADELDLLDTILFTRTDDDTYEKPFASLAMLMLNWWNHVVKAGCDEYVHQRLFANDVFWLDFTFIGRVDSLKPWIVHMLRLIYNEFSDSELERYFDSKRLLREVDHHTALPVSSSTDAIFAQ